MNEVDFSKVGLKMKQLRSERGITQEQVAKDLNCTVPFVSKGDCGYRDGLSIMEIK